MLEYNFKKEDFDKSVNFAVKYYMDPSKSPAGRTSAEPRGLGAVMDAFIRGKLIEISIKKILEELNDTKRIKLDFDIKSTYTVKDEADIIDIEEDGARRAPQIFVEIKNTSINDRWIGLTEEQLKTIKDNSKGKEIQIVYGSISSKNESTNPQSIDLVGMYLKSISKSPVFSKFEDLNAKAKIEFILSADDLEKYGERFLKGDLLYETNLFKQIKYNSIRKKDGSLRKNIQFKNRFKNCDDQIQISRENGTNDSKFGIFKIKGSFKTFVKKNPKSQRNYIYCLDDTLISNNIFGKFKLKKNCYYQINLITLGRDPTLKRNNLWISKKRIYELIENGYIETPNIKLQEIANNI